MLSHENRWNWKVKGEKELEVFGMLLLASFHSGVTEKQQNVADKRTCAWRAESKFWIIATSCGSVFTSLQGSTKSQEIVLLQIIHNSRQRPPLIPHTRCPQCKFFHLLLEWIVKLTTYKKDIEFFRVCLTSGLMFYFIVTVLLFIKWALLSCPSWAPLFTRLLKTLRGLEKSLDVLLCQHAFSISQRGHCCFERMTCWKDENIE